MTGQKVDLKVKALVYVPGKILTAICFPDKNVEIENEFPHITLMIGDKWTPKMSNVILTALFSNTPKLKTWYECLKTAKNPQVKIEYNSELKIDKNTTSEVFMISFDESENITLHGTTKHFY